MINGKYFQVGFRSLLKGYPNMDSLIAIGAGTDIAMESADKLLAVA